MKNRILSSTLCVLAFVPVACEKNTEHEQVPVEIALSVSPSELAFSSENEVKVLSVETDASEVEITDNLSWLVIEKTEDGFSIEALENTATDSRSGVLTVFAIEGKYKETLEVKVTQQGAGAKAQFPDAEFRRLMLELCDADGDGLISQAEADRVGELDLVYDSESTERSVIKSLEGIKLFRNLRNLDCSFNALTSLDLSGMEHLEFVDCSYNLLTSLNLSACPKLLQVYANVNALTSLDLSGNEALKFVQAYKNRISSFELKDKVDLGYLDISQNALTSIKISGCPKLGILNCGSNYLTRLDLSDLPYVYSLGGYRKSRVSIDVSGFPELLMLECYDNNITMLDLSACPTLGSVRCSNNLIEELLLPQNKKDLVTYVICSGNRLKSLDVTMYPNLKTLDCATNFLTELKVSGCSMLESFKCDENLLEALDLSGLTSLINFTCTDNKLSELSLVECSSIETVDAQRNPLQSLWITAKQQSSKLQIKTDDNESIVKVVESL